MDKADVKPTDANLETLDTKTLLQLIPEFNTSINTQVYRFVRSCDAAFHLANKNQTRVLLVYSLNKIIGPGASDVHSKNFNCWSDLKIFLIEKFSNVKTIAHLNLELQSLFQKPNESVVDYYHRVDLCRSKIIEKLSAEVHNATLTGRRACTEETALSVFVNGLNSDIGSMLRTRNFLDLNDAGKFAMQEEKIRRMNSARQALCRNPVNKSFQYAPKVNQTTIRPSFQRQPQKFCNYCKNNGHTLSECRKRAFNNQKFNQNSVRPHEKVNVNHLNSITADEAGCLPDTVIQTQLEDLQ